MDIFRITAPYLRERFGNTERGAALVEYALLLALIAVVCIVALTTLGQNTERGAALVEYALLLVLIAVVCIVALTTLGGKVSSKFDTIGNSL